MVKETHSKVLHLIADLHREDREKHIDARDKKMPNTSSNTDFTYNTTFYTLMKIHKPTMSTITERLIMSGCDGQQKDKRFHAVIDVRSVTYCSFLTSPQHVGHFLRFMDDHFIPSSQGLLFLKLFNWSALSLSRHFFRIAF